MALAALASLIAVVFPGSGHTLLALQATRQRGANAAT